MKKTLSLFLSAGLIFNAFNLSAVSAPSQKTLNSPKTEMDDNGIVMFTPPSGWYLADPASLPPTVKIMVVGKGQSPYRPSMNLSTEPYKGNLKQYLKIVKSMNEARGNEWKDLGTINTEAGSASFSQVDSQTEWGDTRTMHAILLKNGRVYILTACALKNEFSKFYKDFFNSMKSLRINKDFLDMVAPQRRGQLKTAYENMLVQWREILSQKVTEQPNIALEEIRPKLFEEEAFQTKSWKPYKDMIDQKFTDMGSEWQAFALQKTKDDLFNLKP